MGDESVVGKRVGKDLLSIVQHVDTADGLVEVIITAAGGNGLDVMGWISCQPARQPQKLSGKMRMDEENVSHYSA